MQYALRTAFKKAFEIRKNTLLLEVYVEKLNFEHLFEEPSYAVSAETYVTQKGSVIIIYYWMKYSVNRGSRTELSLNIYSYSI